MQRWTILTRTTQTRATLTKATRLRLFGLLAATALLLSSGCFPGDYQFDRRDPAVDNNPVAVPNGATKATPHTYGAPPPIVVNADASAG